MSNNDEECKYEHRDLAAAPISGMVQSLAAGLLTNSTWITSAVASQNNGFLLRTKDFEETPATYLPLVKADALAEQAAEKCPLNLRTIDGLCGAGGKGKKNAAPEDQSQGWKPETVQNYVDAYRNGTMTPSEVAKRCLQAIRRSEQGSRPMKFFIEVNEDDVSAQAAESTKRWKEGNPLSALDGVPVAVKDEADVKGYRTWAGTGYLGKMRGVAERDADVVARCRAAGMIILGKANMHEIGIGTTGVNANWGTPRNPYHPRYHTGGSSSGSAACVAAGLCPFAVGADGGGSIRIPAALCGMVGLKPTFARVSEGGAVPLAPSVGHLGPIAATVRDCALGYLLFSSPPIERNDANDSEEIDPYPYSDDYNSLLLRGGAPDPHCLDLDNTGDLSNVTAGIYTPYFEDADQRQVETCRLAIDKLKARGLNVVEIKLPELEELRVAHLICILSDMKACIGPHVDKLQNSSRISLAAANAFTADDLIRANKLRTRTIQRMKQLFGSSVDIILTPATGCLAPEIPGESTVGPAAEHFDYLDAGLMGKIMKFAKLANMTGIPGISVPCGYSTSGMPCSLQIMASWYREDLCLRIAKAVEEDLHREKPTIYYDIVKGGEL
eukprot:Clim_evm35s195 gene=Clim_evmTU35s195